MRLNLSVDEIIESLGTLSVPLRWCIASSWVKKRPQPTIDVSDAPVVIVRQHMLFMTQIHVSPHGETSRGSSHLLLCCFPATIEGHTVDRITC